MGAAPIPSGMTLTRYFGGFVRAQVEHLSEMGGGRQLRGRRRVSEPVPAAKGSLAKIRSPSSAQESLPSKSTQASRRLLWEAGTSSEATTLSRESPARNPQASLAHSLHVLRPGERGPHRRGWADPIDPAPIDPAPVDADSGHTRFEDGEAAAGGPGESPFELVSEPAGSSG